MEAECEMAEDVSREVKEMTDEEIVARIVSLGFDGDADRYREFCDACRAGLPKGTGVALRGSVVTAERWEDGSPFDADGHGTSDLDVTLIGGDVMKCWDEEEGYYIPALHTKPLGDKDPKIAPPLNPLREQLQRIARRPVNFQATSNIIMFARDVLLGQPYHMIIEASEEDATQEEVTGKARVIGETGKAEETKTAGDTATNKVASVPDFGGAAGEGA
jgi:hypothetical protein